MNGPCGTILRLNEIDSAAIQMDLSPRQRILLRYSPMIATSWCRPWAAMFRTRARSSRNRQSREHRRSAQLPSVLQSGVWDTGWVC